MSFNSLIITTNQLPRFAAAAAALLRTAMAGHMYCTISMYAVACKPRIGKRRDVDSGRLQLSATCSLVESKTLTGHID